MGIGYSTLAIPFITLCITCLREPRLYPDAEKLNPEADAERLVLRAKSTQGLHDSNHRPSESMDGATDSDLPGEAAAVSAMCISLNSLANAAPGNLAKITFGWHGARPLAL